MPRLKKTNKHAHIRIDHKIVSMKNSDMYVLIISFKNLNYKFGLFN